MKSTSCFALALVSSAHSAEAQVSVTLTSSTQNGPYAPNNVLAVWVEDSAGSFVKTLAAHAAVRQRHLVAWEASSAGDKTDAVTGATRGAHAQSETLSWDLTNVAGQRVPNGDYVIRMESSEQNSSAADQNNQGTFTVAINGSGVSLTESSGGFDATVDYVPLAEGDDGGEDTTGDSDGNGGGNGDGTGGGNGGGGNDEIGNISGACNASGSSSGSLAFLGLALLVLRRRRKR